MGTGGLRFTVSSFPRHITTEIGRNRPRFGFQPVRYHIKSIVVKQTGDLVLIGFNLIIGTCYRCIFVSGIFKFDNDSMAGH